ncbi:hypothetical protein [Nonomuraea sp. NPDC005692]|uniref:hypothetical protein n=1 Tax=Nonomuraea sp. NPDC005692 TaxID=3157168 RepID=UPI0033F8F27C
MDARNEQATRGFLDRIGTVDNVVLSISGRGQAAGPLSAITADALRQAVADKLIPHFLTAKAAATALSEHGSITFVAAASAAWWTPSGVRHRQHLHHGHGPHRRRRRQAEGVRMIPVTGPG